ncbi:MAG: branched-chain amino acid ABC transporter substrate-binding protein [Dongiaceae bacterium]
MRKYGLTLAAAIVAATAIGAGNAAADITVATAGPMTGDYAAFGAQMQRGAEAAVADINAAGGVLGENLVLEVGDDACDPKQATAVANDFVSKGVVFVAGHFCSGSSIPASDVYIDEEILQMSPASTNPAFTEGPFEKGVETIFRTCGRDDQQGQFAGPWIATNYAGKNVAILHDKSTYGKGIADLTKEQMNGAGLQEVLYEAYTAGEQDYTALVTKMKAANIDVIYLGGYHTEGALIIRQAREQGLEALMIGPDSLNTAEFVSIAGDAAEGVMFSNAAEARNLPSATEVVAKIREGGFEPEGYTLSTYAAIQVWAAAANEAGTTNSDAVAAQLRKHDWETVVGTIGFDDKGDLTASAYVWYVFKDGTYAEM